MAAEETKILEVKVETSEAVKKIAAYKTKIDGLKEAEKQYKKEVEDGTMTQKQYHEEMTKSRLEANQYRDAIKVLEKQVTSQIKTQKSNAEILAEVEGLTKTGAHSIVEAEAANKALREAVRNLSDEEESAYAIRQQLNAAIEENTRYIQRNSDEYIRQKMNIGNYTESITLAYTQIKNGTATMQSMGIVASQFAKIWSGNMVRGFNDAIHSGTRLNGVLRLIGNAVISIPIFALIAAITALAASFTRSQKGMEFFQVSMAKLGAVMNVFMDRVAQLGDALIDLIKLDFSSFSSKAKAAFEGMGEEMKEEWKIAGDLRKELIAIEKEETMLGMKRAANSAEIEKLKMASEDVTKSTKERQEAAKKAFDLEKSLMSEEIKLQERRIANQLGFVELTDDVKKTMTDIATGAMTADEAISKLGISSSTIEDLKTFSEDVKELYDKEQSSTTRQIELQNKLNSITKEGKEKQLEMSNKELEAIRQMEDSLLEIIKINKQKERETIAESYNKEIEALKGRLAMEKDLTEQAQADILEAIKAKEKEKQEAVAKLNIVDADIEAERERVKNSYDREIEDLKIRLNTEKDLTEKARNAILETIKAKEIQKEAELDKLNDEAIAKEVERKQKLIQLQLEVVKEGSDKEFELKMEQLKLQREAELKDKELTEQMKLAIVAKYDKLMSDATIKHNQDVANKQAEALRIQFETAMEQAYGNEQEILRIQMEQKKAELDAIQQMEGESLEAFNLRKLQANNAYLDSKQALKDKEVQIEQEKLQAMSDVTGSLISLIDAVGESNKAAAIASKVLALAQISIETGKAIASGVAEAIKIGFPQNLAAIATTIATVIANMATAIKTVKSAKFATGGDVKGAGTGTSDSIPAMLSNGESVLTARATSMFAPILSAFNQAGGGVPIYGQQTGTQAMGEDMLARAFAKGVASMPNPVVSVEEISNVTNRVKVIENLNQI